MSMSKTIGGIGAAALAVVAAYWLYEKKKKETSPSARSRMLRMKADVLDLLGDIKDLNRDAYHRAVEQASEHYRTIKKVSEEELKALVRDLKGDWDEFRDKLLAREN